MMTSNLGVSVQWCEEEDWIRSGRSMLLLRGRRKEKTDGKKKDDKRYGHKTEYPKRICKMDRTH